MRKKTTILKMIKTKTAVKIVVTLIPYVQKAKQMIEYVQYRGMKNIKQTKLLEMKIIIIEINRKLFTADENMYFHENEALEQIQN